ncbi:hypothetical protein BHE74_00013874 [Ensete ventricosum]|nr:hypothetical protein BHE74_00013874 [Ensete ventricosum]RZR86378.1 hypothetical protein BHM03_00013555 [Ensete ventricosum]
MTCQTAECCSLVLWITWCAITGSDSSSLISALRRLFGIFFISGDVHFGEITRYDCGGQYPLYDITSSGLTQAIEKVVPPFFAFAVRAIAWLTPTTMRVSSVKCRYKSCTYAQPNFGAIQIDWDVVPRKIKVEVRGVNGDPVIAVDILLSDLQLGNTNTLEGAWQHQRHCSLEIDLPWFWRHYFAFTILALVSGMHFSFFFIGVKMKVVFKIHVG